MNKLLAVFLLAVPLFAQDTVVRVEVKAGTVSRTWPITLRMPVTITTFTCDRSEMEPGETTTCTVR
jgi:hypothetical protein